MIVRTTAAQVPRHRETRFTPRRVRIRLQQRHGRHHLTRGAETALWAQFIDHRLLDRVQLAIRPFYTLDGGNRPAPNRVSRCQGTCAAVVRTITI